MSGLGAFREDRVLLVDVEGGTSVSSFLLFAEVLASFALCETTGRLIPCELLAFAG